MRGKKAWLTLVLWLLSACAGGARPVPAVPAQTATALPAAPSPMPTEARVLPQRLWLPPTAPAGLRAALRLPDGLQWTDDPAQADWRLEVQPGQPGAVNWVYALVAPFPTVPDEFSSADLRQLWRGGPPAGAPYQRLIVSAETLAVFEVLWGPAGRAVQALPPEQILDAAWQKPFALALVPFEMLEPRWKVLRVDGLSPLQKDLDVSRYPLTVPFAPQGGGGPPPKIQAGNRDPQQMTVLVMTGTTALVRTLAARMFQKGMDYPAGGIGDWLRGADLTHISNEASFNPRCPTPDPTRTSLQLCSPPEMIALLEAVGADIIEMTGNHLMDYERKPLLYTLEQYDQRGLLHYGAGATPEEAQKPVLVTDHGNRLAFLGCNPSGPAYVWVTDTQPGVARCDYEALHAEIAHLRAEGYLPVVTQQYFESYNPSPLPPQRRDFRALIEAGAELVSGSQAHVPQGMDFAQGRFIHYGLGNLFFDQMGVTTSNGVRLKTTRNEFIDRHVFYNGGHISTELLTALLEDYSRPRPMTPQERTALLESMFAASGW